MTWTLDRTTDAGKVRVLITGESVEATHVFEDADIDVLLAIEGTILEAAALGLERIAGDSAVLLRKVRNTDPTADVLFGGAMKLQVGTVQLDATGVSAAFLALASRYRAAAAIDADGGVESDFMVATIVTNEWSRWEAIANSILRSEPA